jgi:hypothetical protein
MHVMVRIALAFLPLLVGARLGLATCDPSVEPDRSDVANARAAVATVCDCGGAAAHRDYVRCAADKAAATLVNKGCTGVVERCASKSTCGKPGYIACCRTPRSGKTSCALKRTATRCVALNGGNACVGAVSSCCDACDAGGCATTTHHVVDLDDDHRLSAALWPSSGRHLRGNMPVAVRRVRARSRHERVRLCPRPVPGDRRDRLVRGELHGSASILYPLSGSRWLRVSHPLRRKRRSSL